MSQERWLSSCPRLVDDDDAASVLNMELELDVSLLHAEVQIEMAMQDPSMPDLDSDDSADSDDSDEIFHDCFDMTSMFDEADLSLQSLVAGHDEAVGARRDGTPVQEKVPR